MTQFFYRPDALPDAQPTLSKHWRQRCFIIWLRNRWKCLNSVVKIQGAWKCMKSLKLLEKSLNCKLQSLKMAFLALLLFPKADILCVKILGCTSRMSCWRLSVSLLSLPAHTDYFGRLWVFFTRHGWLVAVVGWNLTQQSQSSTPSCHISPHQCRGGGVDLQN